jgi:hypothetical protein
LTGGFIDSFHDADDQAKKTEGQEATCADREAGKEDEEAQRNDWHRG